MTRWQEIPFSLQGCFKILKKDEAAHEYFNLSADGFWFSFVAIPLMLVLNFIGKSMEFNLSGLHNVGTLGTFGFAASILPSIVLFFCGMLIITRSMGLSGALPSFIIIYNWAQLAVYVVWTVLSTITLTLLGPEGNSVLGLLFFFGSYFYLYMVIRFALPVDPVAAMGICFMEFAIAILINMAAIQIFLKPAVQ